MEAAHNDVSMWNDGTIFHAISRETEIKSLRVDKAAVLTRCCLIRNSRVLHIPRQVDPHSQYEHRI